MTVRNLLSITDKNEVYQIVVYPTKMQLGSSVKPGNFVSLSLQDPRISKLLDEELLSISAYNNLLVIRI